MFLLTDPGMQKGPQIFDLIPLPQQANTAHFAEIWSCPFQCDFNNFKIHFEAGKTIRQLRQFFEIQATEIENK